MVDFNDNKIAFKDYSTGKLRLLGWMLGVMKRPLLSKVLTSIAKVCLALRIPFTQWLIKKSVFDIFCGGTNVVEAHLVANQLDKNRVKAIWDYAVEGSEGNFDKTKDNIILTLSMADRGSVSAMKMTGISPVGEMALKHWGFRLLPCQKKELELAKNRLEEIITCATELDRSICIDAEESWIQGPIDELIEGFMKTYNTDRAVLHTTVQLYLRDRYEYLNRLIYRARSEGFKVGVKLVRGAYLEKERKQARTMGLIGPLQIDKSFTDLDFNRAITLCLNNLDVVSVNVATHNVKSVEHLIRKMDELGIKKDDPRVECSQLMGMFDRITYPLAENGYNVSKYLPYGAVKDTMPYLMRRVEENSSISEQTEKEIEFVKQELKRRKSEK